MTIEIRSGRQLPENISEGETVTIKDKILISLASGFEKDGEIIPEGEAVCLAPDLYAIATE